MSRDAAIAAATRYHDEGGFEADLGRRVAIRTESQVAGREAELRRYVDVELRGSLEPLGFVCEVVENPVAGAGPFLIARRLEDERLPTVLSYGHGDVIHGQDEEWTKGRGPWELAVLNGRLYGRGTADNEGQHSVNIGALAAVLATRGRLGFNATLLIEMGEEIGSPGLEAICERHRDLLAADVLIASDGPRFKDAQPTAFFGNRGAFNFEMTVALREGAHHSGNWGGLLANPAIILAQALATITDARGRILVDGWLPKGIPERAREMLAGLELEPAPGAPAIDPSWGEPELSAVEKLYAWNTFEVLAFTAGNPTNPVNAIPPKARANGHLRFVVGVDPSSFLPNLRRHLDARGFTMVRLERSPKGFLPASRLDPDDPWVTWAADSLARTSGRAPALLPNFGGALPNHCFADMLAMPTIWIPHSHPGCSQHAPDEHQLGTIAREGQQLMAGLFWDLGEGSPKAA